MVVARHQEVSVEEEEFEDVGEVVMLLVGKDVFRALVVAANREGVRAADFLEAAIRDRAGKSIPKR